MQWQAPIFQRNDNGRVQQDDERSGEQCEGNLKESSFKQPLLSQSAQMLSLQ